MGILAIVVAGLSEFVDDNDRFFTPNIGEITAFEWGICIGIAFIGKHMAFTIQWEIFVFCNITTYACSFKSITKQCLILFTGILGFVLLFKALVMIPPSTASTLRTSQIIVAFVAQVLVNHNIPEIIDVLGAAFIFLAAMMVTFEDQICSCVKKCCPCPCCSPNIDVESSDTATPTQEDLRPMAPGRIRTVSHSLS